MSYGSTLPECISQEILASYADIVRTGQLSLNGHALEWDTSGSTVHQLQEFVAEFTSRLRSLSWSGGLDSAELGLAAYWVCKATSFNYILIGIILMLRRKVGCVTTIETRSTAGEKLQYCVEVLTGLKLRVSLDWSWEGNILDIHPERGKKTVGTITRVSTEFNCPPAQGFRPIYNLQIQVKKLRVGRLTLDVASMASRLGVGTSLDRFVVDEPLHSPSADGLLEGTEALGSRSFGHVDDAVGWLHLRVHGIRGLQQVFSPDVDTQAGLIAICTLAGREQRSGAHPIAAAADWGVVLSFPVVARDLRGYLSLRIFSTGSSAAPVPQDALTGCLGDVVCPVSTVLRSGGATMITEALDKAGELSVKFELEFVPARVEADYDQEEDLAPPPEVRHAFSHRRARSQP
mmetsp:Transcript_30910/g.67728  ORF Transcript_30910/g.67728 Transcript_30910/m.67728 type:complete len:404 (-) Transcript_30910:35-1246(-)